MAAPGKGKKRDDESGAISLEEFSKARRKKPAGAVVSIRKGKLLFLPTAFPKASEKPAPTSPEGTETNGTESD
jgi:hypothetical protein